MEEIQNFGNNSKQTPSQHQETPRSPRAQGQSPHFHHDLSSSPPSPSDGRASRDITDTVRSSPVRPTLLTWPGTAPAPIALSASGTSSNMETTLCNMPSGAVQNSHANTYTRKCIQDWSFSCYTSSHLPRSAQRRRGWPEMSPANSSSQARVPDRKTVRCNFTLRGADRKDPFCRPSQRQKPAVTQDNCCATDTQQPHTHRERESRQFSSNNFFPVYIRILPLPRGYHAKSPSTKKRQSGITRQPTCRGPPRHTTKKDKTKMLDQVIRLPCSFTRNDSLSSPPPNIHTSTQNTHTQPSSPRLLIAKTIASKPGIKCHVAVGYSVFALMPSKRCK